MVKWGVIPCSELETIKQNCPGMQMDHLLANFQRQKDCPLSFTVHGPLCLILQINIVIEKNLAIETLGNLPTFGFEWNSINASCTNPCFLSTSV
jgi:hypothetical protein